MIFYKKRSSSFGIKKISQTENQNRIKVFKFYGRLSRKNTKEILEANSEDYQRAEKSRFQRLYFLD